MISLIVKNQLIIWDRADNENLLEKWNRFGSLVISYFTKVGTFAITVSGKPTRWKFVFWAELEAPFSWLRSKFNYEKSGI